MKFKIFITVQIDGAAGIEKCRGDDDIKFDAGELDGDWFIWWLAEFDCWAAKAATAAATACCVGINWGEIDGGIPFEFDGKYFKAPVGTKGTKIKSKLSLYKTITYKWKINTIRSSMSKMMR